MQLHRLAPFATTPPLICATLFFPFLSFDFIPYSFTCYYCHFSGMTTSVTDLWLSIEHYGDSTRNWHGQRRYEASLAKRVEGFTEHLSTDISASSELNGTIPLRLLQFQPAWEEQLLLRMAKLPHLVVHSKYAVTEAVGPLPAVQDLSRSAMMGKNKTDHNKSAILEYLEKYHGLALDESLSNSDTELYLALLHHQLEPCRMALMCQEDEWNRVYKQRCIQAGGGRLSQWQARSFRRFLRYQQTHEDRHMTTATAVQRVKNVYQLLHDKLSSSSNPSSHWILGTKQPTRLDVALWDHLMHALTDVHLVVVLAEFPLLIQFVQTIWDIYFGNPTEEWQIENSLQNAANPFAQVPSLLSTSPKSNNKDDEDYKSFRHAVELMEHLLVQDRNLMETVRVAKEARLLQKQPPSNDASFRTWHRWRMGGSYHPPPANDNAQGNEEKVRRDYHRSDEAWIASMALSTAMALCVFGVLGGSRGD